MSTEAALPPQYNPSLVEQVILEEAVELHPERHAVNDLVLRIVADPDDDREIGTANQAIHSLRDAGLFHLRDNEVVEPTEAALRACTLLAR